MITSKAINELYKKYAKAPKSVDMLNLSLLFDYAAHHHNIQIDPETGKLTIGSVDSKSPFHTLSIKRINAIVPFEDWVALVMHSSIVFLNRKNSQVSVHLKPLNPGFMDRVRGVLTGH